MSEEDRARWNETWAHKSGVRRVTPFLASLDALLPRRGRALDVAGGQGQNAEWLAARGLEVTLVDISDVAIARALSMNGQINRIQRDLEREPLPPGPWDVIVCFNYLQRSLFEVFARELAPGGLLLFLQPTRKNLERNPKPRQFLLEEGELRGLVQGLEIHSLTEEWSDENRHEARLVARRPA